MQERLCVIGVVEVWGGGGEVKGGGWEVRGGGGEGRWRRGGWDVMS